MTADPEVKVRGVGLWSISLSSTNKMYTTQAGMEAHAGIDLRLAVLRYLPTPVLVLAPSHTTVFANRALERVLGSADLIHSTGTRLVGQPITELGIRLLYNRTWAVVLENLACAQEIFNSEGSRSGGVEPVHEVDVVVDNPSVRFEERHFQVLISTITSQDGVLFILSLEKSTQVDRKIDPPERESRSSDEGISLTPGEPRRDPVIDPPRDILRYKTAVFDSSSIMGFILTADERYYLTNKRAREVIGDLMGGPDGCDGSSMRTRTDAWDATFTHKLDKTEYPGVKLVRSRLPFVNYRCGFIHATTRAKLVVSVSGECLYDDDTEYSDFLFAQQARLLRSHETICDLMPHMVWTTGPDGLVDWYSKRWYNFTGLTREESVGDGFRNAVHPEDISRLMDTWNYNRERGSESETEARYRRKDGLYRWMLVRAVPYMSDTTKILKWYGTCTDIHDLVIARIDAARNKLQMLTVLAHAEVSMFALDKDRIVQMAEGGLQWDWETSSYNVSRNSSLIGKDAIEVASQTQPGGAPEFQKSVLDVLSGAVGMAVSEDTIGDRVFRTRVVADLEQNTEDGAQNPIVKGVLGLTIDITDVKARAALAIDNARLTIQEQAAKESNRMKSQFLANMSHELRTPTAGVIGMAELLGDDPTLTNEQKEYVNSILLSAKALLTIVNDILDFSKIESGRLDIEDVPFNLASITGELCKLLSMFAQQKGLEFIYENNMQQGVELFGDPGRVRQVLSNLLTNALKFTREGHVKLVVSSCSQGVPGLDEDETLEVKFSVEDTGIGIEPTVLEKLFTPFSQGDSSTARLYGGTGLGLTISKNLASLMNGSIELESTANVGSKATFVVPFRVSSWSEEEPFPPSPTTPSPGFQYHIPPSRSPTLMQPLANHTISQDLINQQISSSVTEFTPPSLSRSRKGSLIPLSRHSSVDTIPTIPTELTPEQRSRTHVLVVEDNAINQTIAIKNIRNLGFSVTAVWNGREALSYLRSPSPKQPRPAIILMDVQMPVMDGYEATRLLRTGKDYTETRPTLENVSEGRRLSVTLDGTEIANATHSGHGKMKMQAEPSSRRQDRSLQRQMSGGSSSIGGTQGQLKDIPVIAMTASAIQGDREKCHEAGMDDYLPKPVNKVQLEEMLIKWVGRRR